VADTGRSDIDICCHVELTLRPRGVYEIALFVMTETICLKWFS